MRQVLVVSLLSLAEVAGAQDGTRPVRVMATKERRQPSPATSSRVKRKLTAQDWAGAEQADLFLPSLLFYLSPVADPHHGGPTNFPSFYIRSV